ncbi:hypothetical protein OO007_03590 [Cocleimonas sp. KMM 6892]|uniref:hypothetical protein n=1 Tax=unclassified Cocleimonas TaxID=2639732 RepID=UPI002DBFC3CC|nr:MULTISPECIES: hypothetical protein [unclassified Cocleimonas]MEB8431296.1 hypothetical protein [Cocleimonas sp. KMM 6892]MEC4713932.1 hypothetical protein [Cocleimonas sp. KMM 6895]MEC4743263.1 hypothetical protein [Cocleimonas sp. KMM 6896]
MILVGSLIFAFLITLFLVSKIASMLHAKKPDMGRIFLASIVGSIAAAITLIPLGIFLGGIDPNIMLILSIAIVFIVSSMAFKYINVMTWSGAITTNIANIVLSLVALTASVVLNGESIDETLSKISGVAKENANMVQSVAKGDLDAVMSKDTSMEQESNEQAAMDEEVALDDDIEPTFKESDLLPAGTIKELKAKEKKVYIEPKFRVVSISSINSAVGKNIRILNSNDASITGLLRRVSGNNAVIEQHIGGGIATTPISLAKIRKLEVYR